MTNLSACLQVNQSRQLDKFVNQLRQGDKFVSLSSSQPIETKWQICQLFFKSTKSRHCEKICQLVLMSSNRDNVTNLSDCIQVNKSRLLDKFVSLSSNQPNETTWQICQLVFKSTDRDYVTNLSAYLQANQSRQFDKFVSSYSSQPIETTWQICLLVFISTKSRQRDKFVSLS